VISERLLCVERESWGSGPWDDEPDRAEWEYLGYACLAVRNARFDIWCGYLGVGPDHPPHGRSTDAGGKVLRFQDYRRTTCRGATLPHPSADLEPLSTIHGQFLLLSGASVTVSVLPFQS
jgi:hypothetical protein